jgi:hypothetical protein
MWLKTYEKMPVSPSTVNECAKVPVLAVLIHHALIKHAVFGGFIK